MPSIFSLLKKSDKTGLLDKVESVNGVTKEFLYERKLNQFDLHL